MHSQGSPTGVGWRRRLLAPLLLLSLLLAACGETASTDADDTAGASDTEQDAEATTSDTEPDPEPDPEPDAEETSEEAADDAGDASSRIVTDYQDREIEVPTEPTAVVGIDDVQAVELVALGITPAAASEQIAGNFIGLEEYLPDGFDPAALPSFGQNREPDLEVLAGLGPDLLISNEFQEEALPTFEQIAPTVAVAWPSNGAWQQRFRDVAEAVGRSDEANAVQADYEAFVDALPDGLGETTVAFVRANSDGSFRMDTLPGSFPGSVAEQAGIQLLQPDDVEIEAGRSWYDFSGERLGVLEDADLVVVADFTVVGADEDGLTMFGTNPLWDALPAVQNGNVAQVPGLVYNGGNYFAAKALLDALADLLT